MKLSHWVKISRTWKVGFRTITIKGLKSISWQWCRYCGSLNHAAANATICLGK